MKKRICLVHPDLNRHSGGQRVCINLANEFYRRGYDVRVVSLEKCEKTTYKLNEGILLESVSKDFRSRKALTRKNFCRLLNIYKSFSAEIVMGIGASTALALLPVLLTKGKVIICEHTAYKNRFDQSPKSFINRYLGVKIADKVVTLTKDNKDECIRKFRVSSDKVEYIYNFISDELIHQNKNEHIYNIDAKAIISAGRIDPVKGYDMLIDVAELVFKNNPKWVWNIYGPVDDEKYYEELLEKIHQKGLEGKIRFCGQTNDLQNVFSQHAICVLTSYHEGLPMVLLEAKMAGLPLISFDIATGPNEIIDDGVNGKLIPAYDIEKMAKCIDELIKNKKERIRLSSGAEVLKEKFSKENIMNKWIELIESI